MRGAEKEKENKKLLTERGKKKKSSFSRRAGIGGRWDGFESGSGFGGASGGKGSCWSGCGSHSLEEDGGKGAFVGRFAFFPSSFRLPFSSCILMF